MPVSCACEGPSACLQAPPGCPPADSPLCAPKLPAAAALELLGTAAWRPAPLAGLAALRARSQARPADTLACLCRRWCWPTRPCQRRCASTRSRMRHACPWSSQRRGASLRACSATLATASPAWTPTVRAWDCAGVCQGHGPAALVCTAAAHVEHLHNSFTCVDTDGACLRQ